MLAVVTTDETPATAAARRLRLLEIAFDELGAKRPEPGDPRRFRGGADECPHPASLPRDRLADPKPDRTCRSYDERALIRHRLPPIELGADHLQPRGSLRVPGVHGEQRSERLQLVTRRAVLDRPADMAAQSVVDATLSDQRREDDQAAVAQAETVVRPGTARGVDRLLSEPVSEPLREPA